MINVYRFSQGQIEVELFSFVLTGTDVRSFLNSQCTYDVPGMAEKSFHLVSFLDPQGKLETYGWLLKDGRCFTFLVPPALAERTRSRLNKFLVSEDVEIEEKGAELWTFVLGGETGGFQGKIFDEAAILVKEKLPYVPMIPKEDADLWRQLNGWPSFSGEDFTGELINNSRLFETALSQKKGCYPGQETVSKIATHRGAAYSPVLIETSKALTPGALTIGGKRIGEAGASLVWHSTFFTPVKLLRDFRVEGMKLSFQSGQESIQGVVRYYPLLKGDPTSKAQELYDSGLEDFRFDRLKVAEEKLHRALAYDKTFADAYEALGVMLGRQERFAEAIKLMEQLIEVDPGSAMAHTNLSLFLMKTGKIEEAENHKSLATLKSFKKFGEESQLKEAEAQALRAQQEDWLRREKMFREVLEIDPEDTLANYGLGSIAVERSHWDEGRGYLEKVIAADPKYSVAYLALGKAYKGLGQIDKSREIFQQGIIVAAAKGDFMPANQMQAELDRL